MRGLEDLLAGVSRINSHYFSDLKGPIFNPSLQNHLTFKKEIWKTPPPILDDLA